MAPVSSEGGDWMEGRHKSGRTKQSSGPLVLRAPLRHGVRQQSDPPFRLASRHRHTMRLYITAAAAETEPTSDNEKFTSTVIPLAARADVHQFIWCAGVFLVLVTIWTGLRIYSRRIRRLPLAIEDALYHISVVSRSPAGLSTGISRPAAGCFTHFMMPLRFLSSASLLPCS